MRTLHQVSQMVTSYKSVHVSPSLPKFQLQNYSKIEDVRCPILKIWIRVYPPSIGWPLPGRKIRHRPYTRAWPLLAHKECHVLKILLPFEIGLLLIITVTVILFSRICNMYLWAVYPMFRRYMLLPSSGLKWRECLSTCEYVLFSSNRNSWRKLERMCCLSQWGERSE
jgi:hypothetical protein